MTNDDTKQIGVRLNREVWRAFRQDVKERNGTVRGQLKPAVENALQEYMDASHGGDVSDRLTRLEEQMDRVVTLVEQIDAKKQDSDVSNTVENRIDKIIETVESEAEGAPRVHDSVVEMAIKQHAGQSDPTIGKYKDLLQEQHFAFEDPRSDSSYHYLDSGIYCQAVNEMIQEREIGQQEYLDIVEGEYSRDWWAEQLEKVETGDDRDGVAFH